MPELAKSYVTTVLAALCLALVGLLVSGYEANAHVQSGLAHAELSDTQDGASGDGVVAVAEHCGVGVACISFVVSPQSTISVFWNEVVIAHVVPESGLTSASSPALDPPPPRTSF